MKTALIHHPIYEKHDTGPGHPETPLRYEVIINALRAEESLWTNLLEIKPEPVARGIIQGAHTPQHFKIVEDAFSKGFDRLDTDTAISVRSFDVSLYAAGGACAAVDAVMQG